MNQKELKKINMTLRTTLPPVTRRWLDHVLPENVVVPSQIQIKQEGSMDIRGRWTPFTAEGIYEGAPLSFNWRARLRMLPGIWIISEDGHSNGENWGGARLWGVSPMG